MSKKAVSFLAIIYGALLIVYSYLEMTALETAVVASSALAISKVIVMIISLYLLFFKGGINRQTPLGKYWFVWVLWLLIEFLFFLARGDNSNILSYTHNFFSPLCFYLVYTLCIKSQASSKYLVLDFVLLFLFTGGYALYLSFTYNTSTIEAGRFVSNLVFWPLCPFVFVPLVRRPILRYVLFVPMMVLVVILAKRSAMIILLLELIVFSYTQLKTTDKKNRKRNFILYIIIGVGALGVISTNLSQFTNSSFSRFETMQEDRGSGRVDVYNSAMSNIENFSIIDLFFGRGFSSINEIGNTNAHNDALQIFYEYGFVGLLLYLALFVILFRRLKKVRKFAEDYYVGYIFCIITIVVLGMFSNLITFNSYFAFICSYLGMAEAAVYRGSHLVQNNS